ncbi:hypothetical protein GYMLUDRAFT_241822 [Collybiopsis luxurians FD-317 M1]|uniref:Uncharacterized protein n=1 Tax=Collybiopsis luxurians FD-317 M1 TaxID=944289 RepID=A0A0D0BH53_9AGAR|nr:hypothetical protein GYMLUDRAFT_241822 [Collybiopsis luxurians FD-317 M1]
MSKGHAFIEFIRLAWHLISLIHLSSLKHVNVRICHRETGLSSITWQQRTQLIRSTKKLGRVLGINPQLVDIHAHYSDEDDCLQRKGSIDSTASSSSSLRTTRSRARTTHSRSSSRTASPASHTSRHPLCTCSTDDLSLVNSTNDSKPLLRLAPPMSRPSSTSLSSLSSDDDDSLVESSLAVDKRYTIRPPTSTSATSLAAGDRSSRDSFLSIVGAPPPSFTIPSSNSMRLAKMDWIRRLLGDEVPVHLVCPQEDDEEDEEDYDYVEERTPPAPAKTTVTIHYGYRPLPPLPTQHESVLEALQCPRLAFNPKPFSGQAQHKIKCKPVPKFDEEEVKWAPSPVRAPAPVAISVPTRKDKERLSLILELPHEHDDEDEGDSGSDEDEDEEELLVTPESESNEATPIWAWFGNGSGGNEGGYENFLNYELAHIGEGRR